MVEAFQKVLFKVYHSRAILHFTDIHNVANRIINELSACLFRFRVHLGVHKQSHVKRVSKCFYAAQGSGYFKTLQASAISRQMPSQSITELGWHKSASGHPHQKFHNALTSFSKDYNLSPPLHLTRFLPTAEHVCG